VRVVGDVSGGALAGKGFEHVVAYETEYGRLSQAFSVETLCLYDARAHTGVETAAVLRLHPDLFHHPIDQLVS